MADKVALWLCGVSNQEMGNHTLSIVCIHYNNVHLKKCASLSYKYSKELRKKFYCSQCRNFVSVQLLLFSHAITVNRKTHLWSFLQSISKRNKCMCGSSHVLCYGVSDCVWSIIILSRMLGTPFACCTNKADCQWTQTLSNLIT